MEATANSAQAGSAACLRLLDGASVIDGTWDSGCLSENPPLHGSGDRYARFYIFALEEATEFTVELSSDDQDTYLYVLEGWGKGGEVLHSHDDIEVPLNLNSRIQATLEPGDYTIEATTYEAERGGEFRLSVAGLQPAAQVLKVCFDGSVRANDDDDLTLVSGLCCAAGIQEELSGDATLNWSADVAIEDWDGVSVEGAPERVTKLILEDSGLTGEIPPGISGLDQLTELRLSGNELTGAIPAEVGALANLKVLDLYFNNLSGEIPSELGKFPALEEMDLSFNELEGAVPRDFGGLINLQVLKLDLNLLSGAIPGELSKLDSLTTLSLTWNQLVEEIPEELGELSRLETLEVGASIDILDAAWSDFSGGEPSDPDDEVYAEFYMGRVELGQIG